MGISVYYNLNHHYFKIDYSTCTSDYFKKKYLINGHNIMFIQIIDKSSTNLHYLKLHKYKTPLKKRLSSFFFLLSRKLDNDVNSPKRNHWYMWKK